MTIFFDKWKYLIKAAIWSGKSFLFFDGPVYALYKYSSRNILNTNSEDGFIKLLFDIEWQYYLVIRKLKKWKNKDSCSSVMYGLKSPPSPLFKEEGEWNSLKYNVDIEKLLKNDNVEMEEISFKNETDLQQEISAFLPPKEVFLSTIFLMQDADNIFELDPRDRLSVLKNVFWLLWIDDAKDKVLEKRREIQAQLKVTADTSKHDSKLKEWLWNYIWNYNNLKDFEFLSSEFGIYKDFFSEINNIADKVNMQDFSVSDFPHELTWVVNKLIEEKKNVYQKLKHQIETIEQNKTNYFNQIKNIDREKLDMESSNRELDEKIKQINPSKIERLKNEKIEYYDEQKRLENEFNKTKDCFTNILNDKDLTIASGYELVKEMIQKWKLLSEEKNNIELKIKNNDLENQKKVDGLKMKIENANEKQKYFDEQLLKLDERLKEFDNNMDAQAKFHCEKIEVNCPFIKVINKRTFDQLEEQKDKILDEKKELETKIKESNIVEIIKWYQLEIDNIKKMSGTKWEETKWLVEIEKELKELKEFLTSIDWKNIQNIYNQNVELETKIKQNDIEIMKLEDESKRLEEYKMQKSNLAVKLEQINKQKDEIEIQIKELDKQEAELKQSSLELNYQEILEIEEVNNEMETNLNNIKNLVDDFNDTQLKVKILQEEEKMIANLYQIFSKELLLIVLQDSLPTLSEIINAFLAQVVDYQISFWLVKSWSDKLELEAKIYDEKWDRDVKSLSGWQRIILKLVRMLAISSYIQSPMLFLDETINNLDMDTVWKVAEMLEDFVKQRDIKLYTVTHSQQIQEMDIRDSVIQI